MPELKIFSWLENQLNRRLETIEPYFSPYYDAVLNYVAGVFKWEDEVKTETKDKIMLYYASEIRSNIVDPEAHDPEAHDPEAHDPEAHDPEAHDPEEGKSEVQYSSFDALLGTLNKKDGRWDMNEFDIASDRIMSDVPFILSLFSDGRAFEVTDEEFLLLVDKLPAEILCATYEGENVLDAMIAGDRMELLDKLCMNETLIIPSKMIAKSILKAHENGDNAAVDCLLQALPRYSTEEVSGLSMALILGKVELVKQWFLAGDLPKEDQYASVAVALKDPDVIDSVLKAGHEVSSVIFGSTQVKKTLSRSKHVNREQHAAILQNVSPVRSAQLSGSPARAKKSPGRPVLSSPKKRVSRSSFEGNGVA